MHIRVLRLVLSGLMGALLVFGKDGRVYAVGQSELLVIFAVVCLAKDLVFLGYEKFGT